MYTDTIANLRQHAFLKKHIHEESESKVQHAEAFEGESDPIGEPIWQKASALDEKGELQCQVKVNNGIGILEAWRHGNVFRVKSESQVTEVAMEDIQLIVPFWLRDCPRKYGTIMWFARLYLFLSDFIVQAHILRLQFKLQARVIYKLLLTADSSGGIVTSEALVNTTWLHRHDIRVDGSQLVLKR